MITELEFDTMLHWKCNMFGKVFEHSIEDRYSSKTFIEQVMLEEKYDWLFINDDCQEWCDDCYLYRIIKKDISCSLGETESAYFLWFIGYLYKYWMTTRKMDRKIIYKLLPTNKLRESFEFYHTQDWDYIINDVLINNNIGPVTTNG